jgi:UDP:flavonoid glycosyltransferase YjiC (YdhE family)
VEDIPHSWLFPQLAAVVHHGGAGTTAAGLRAGRPTVVVPFFTDQPFWGRRVHDLGAGPLPLPHKQLTAAGLAAAIRQAVGDPQIRARAATLSTRLQAEDGVTTAVAALQHYVTAGPPLLTRPSHLVKEPSHAERPLH